MAGNPRTKNGYSMHEMSSMIQKAIRRCDIPHAAYAAAELYPGYRTLLWNRLLTVSAEDCYGIMTQEIMALAQADERMNGKKPAEKANTVFLAKAVVLLCMARKNRDADYVACNYLWGNRKLTPEEIVDLIDPSEVERLMREEPMFRVPDYVYDVHTYLGKKRGKTRLDFFIDENEALEPRQMSLFDHGSFGEYYQRSRDAGFRLDPAYDQRWKDYMAGRESDPTHNGKDFPNPDDGS